VRANSNVQHQRVNEADGSAFTDWIFGQSADKLQSSPRSGMSLGLVLAILGAVGLGSIIKAAAFTNHWRRNSDFLRFRFREAVDVVISTDTRLETPLTDTGRTYPRFVASLGSLEAAVEFSRLIGQVRSRKPVRIQMSEKLISPLQGDLVLLGGPVLNDPTGMFLHQLNQVYPDLNLVFEDDKASAAKISVGSFSACYDCVMQHRHPDFPADDYALIVAWTNPFAPCKRRAFLCAGFTYHGTAAATHYLIDHVISRRGPLGCERTGLARVRRGWSCFVIALRIQFSAEKPVLIDECAFAKLHEYLPDRRAGNDVAKGLLPAKDAVSHSHPGLSNGADVGFSHEAVSRVTDHLSGRLAKRKFRSKEPL
jgi:hypothetical protein